MRQSASSAPCAENPTPSYASAEAHVARHILEKDAPAENVLHGAHAPNDVLESLVGVRQWQEVVQILAADTRPAQMIGNPGRLDALRQRFQLVEIGAIQRSALPIDSDTRASPWVMFANARQVVQGLAARDEVVLRQGLKPVNGRQILENRLVVIDPQTEPNPNVGAAACLKSTARRIV